ncbi:hypothetical protein N7471_012103 [Penicillium samsonianum]|uniref:uncharacterized protein n=1 Tax=Penicillium samsonianum TaxID=1882272 RepID=UPI0025484EC9|nr:uncharacterized protein N7471_012103 [Penicillium samsonianum]KAJ6124786.1 hypothetical protein N7471_012103 [Penicillium samsonianum]
MFKALMGGGRSSSSSDVRSSSKSSRRKSEKPDKSDTRSISSRKSSRGDDRDRGLGDLSSYSPSAPRSKRGPPSIAGDSIASTYVTAEPEAIDDSDRYYIERTPKRGDSEREGKSSRRRDQGRSESPEREKRRSRRGTQDTVDDDLDREHDRRDRRRTQSGDPYVPPIATNMPPSAPGAQFAAEIGAPGFSQFPMQYDTGMPSAGHSPAHEVPYDPHVQQQFPGQFPEQVAAPYRPPNPAGAAADYYGDQGQSVEHQPGIRPAPPSVLPNTQAHLMAASPSANPPPEPSSLGETGAAAAYFDDDFHAPAQQGQPPAMSSSRPPKPSKPSKPSSSGVLPAAAVGAAAYGISGMMSHSESHSPPQHTTSYTQQGQPVVHGQPMEYDQPMASSSHKPPTKPSHSHSVSEGVGLAAAGAATGYMMGHHHHSSSPEHAQQYAFQHHEQSSQAGGMLPYAPGHNNAMYAAGAGGYAAHAAHNPGFYPHGPSALAFQERQRGAMGRFVDFWRDPEAVGRFEDYTETIGVCKYCFQPGTSSLNAPRKHHYHRRRRHSPDRRSSGSSRISKISRYNSSEDEGRRRPKSKKSSSWLPGMLAGYATKSLFSSKEFDDSYSLRSGRVASSHGEEDDRRSHTSRGVTRRSGRSPQREHYADSKHAPQSGYSRHTRSRSRSSSRTDRHSYLKEAALGAAVGGAALAVAKSRNRSRSRSPERRQSRKDSSSSSSFVNLPRPGKKSIAGGIGSFFTASSENRKKRHTKKRSGFFSFKSGSSSSSLDNDLAFGDGFSKKSSKLKKKGKKGKDVDAALLELSDTATRLAGSSPHGPGRTAGQMYTARSRQSNYAHSTTQDEEWVDAESEDQSSSSVSSALAFGGSSAESSSDSASSKWGWRWGSKKDKKKKDKRSSATNAALVAGTGAIGAAAISSAHHRDSNPPSRSGSLQQVYPMPTSDPSRFDVAKMSPSVSAGEPTPIRPGPIPLRQPQPFTPVSQSVYTTQGAVPGSIPVYSASAVPPIFASGVEHYGSQFQGPRDAAWAPEESSYTDRRRPHRRSDSSPVFPTQETASSLKRRFTAKDQASVQFNLTEEQAERERHLTRRDKNYRDEVADQPVQLIDREEELARQETERRERRRKERDDEERRYAGDREKDPSSWVGVAAAGAVGAAAASTILSRKTDDDEASEASQRYNERREKRRAERKRDTDAAADTSIVSRFEPAQPIDKEVTAVEHHEDQKKGSPRSPRPAQVYDDYAEFYAPEEIRHSTDDHARSSGSTNMPTIVEVEPASERRTQEESAPAEVDYSYEPYQHVDRLPWPVPGLNFIEPTPPQSVNGGSPRERPTGSRVSWGEHETHEYEIPSSSEQDPLEHDISPIEISAKDVPLPASDISQSQGISSTSEYGADIEFAATIAAATAAAGFDPSLITDDPSYHTRTSPPGSEDEHTFTSPWSASARKEPHGFVEGELEEIDHKSTKDITSAPEHVVQDKDELFFDELESFSRDRDISSGRRDKSSIAHEVIEQLNGKYGKRDRTASPEKDVDVFSMPGGFDTAESRGLADERSVVSAPAPVAMDPETPTKSKSKKSRRSGDVFDLPEFQERELAESPVLKDETSKSHKSRSSGDDFEIYESREASPSRGDTYSLVSAPFSKDETSKSKSRKSRRSGDDLGIAEYPESVVAESRDDSFSVISAPVSKDETSKSKSRKSRRSGDDFEIYESREPSESRDDTRSVTSTPAGKEYESSKSGKSRRSGDDYDITRSREISESRDDNRSVFSAPVSKDETSKSRRSRRSGDDFDISRSRDVSESRDETRSVVSESAKSRKSRRSGDDFDPRRDAEAAPDDAEGGEEKKRRRKRRSRHEGDTFSVDDDARSAITDIGDDKSERRKHRHRSSREADFDDNASITSSPARIDESREKRRGKDEKEKSGGFLRSIFGSQVSAPAERVRSDHSRSSSLDKRSSREAISEAGVDDERRRKKRSSKHRSSSNGDELDRYMSDKEKGTQDDTNLEEYRSSRQQKEERRRHRYEEIVDSGRKRESEKRPRSQSTSPPATERTLDLTPKSLSRPASPETSHPQGSRSPKQRRHSVAKSTTESPTAVPLHFRRPPTSPGLSRAVPVEQAAPIASPGSPSQQRNRRPGSVEFRNSREIRPLWLVERHSLIKGEPETEEPLPSLPSSKTSSRVPSTENLRSLHDDDGLKSWEHVDLSHSIMENQRPTGLTISTDQANESHDRDLDLLGSQQATPTAEHFQDAESRKERPRYEFHSPSELLQDPAILDELPPSPTLEALPSAEGSLVGVGSREQETQRTLDALEGVSRPQPKPESPTQEKCSFLSGVADFAKGAGFAGVVDAAAIAAAKEHDNSRCLPADEPAKAHDFSDIVDAAVSADGSSHYHDKAPVDEEAPAEPVTAIEENYPAVPESVQPEMDTAKEFVPESTEQPVASDLQAHPETEVAPDEGAAAQSSKKKNKKKKGKKNQVQDADLGAPEEPPAQKDSPEGLVQEPSVKLPVVEAVFAEPEVVVPEPAEASRELGPELEVHEPVVEGAPVEPEVAVPEQSEAEPIEASRELDIEPLVEAAQEAEVGNASEPELAQLAPTESEQAEDTASSTKKAKRDKKKQKKKSKNASTSEVPADDTVVAQPEDDTSASKEIEGQQEDKAPAPAEEIMAAPFPEDIATSTESLENSSDEPAISSATINEEQARSQQESRELVEPVEQVSAEESILPVSEDSSLPIEEEQTPEPAFTDADETPITGATQPEAEELSRSLEETEKPTEYSPPEAPLNDTMPEITETPKEDTEGEDNFEEAVEEQIPQPVEEKELAPEPPIEVAADTPTEGSETKAEKRKNKKKKNRKSAAVEETQISAETPAPETESQPEIQELEPEQSAVFGPADTQSPPIGGEALPSDPEHLEQPTKDVEQPSEATIEEPAATQEQEQVSLEAAVDATPTVTEPVGPTGPSDELSQPAVIDVQPNAELPEPSEEASREIPEPSAVQTQPEAEVQAAPQGEVEAEPEVALTAAQKKKAKKNKKKGKQSDSAIPDDEKPAESTSPAPVIEAVAEDIAKETPLVTEDAPVDAPTQEHEMDLPVEVEQSLEPEQLPEPEQISEVVPTQEQASSGPLPEPAAEATEAEAAKEEHIVSEEQPKAEESPAEPEVPMTAAERKKAKKAKKKQQKEQEESTGSTAEDIKPIETVPVPDAESAEPSKDIAPATEIDDVAPADFSAPVYSEPAQTEQDVAPTSTNEPEAAPVTEDTLPPTDTETVEPTKDIEPLADAEPPVEDAAPSSEIEATEVVSDVPLVSEEATALVDTAQDLDQQDDVVKAEEPKSEDVTPAPTEEPSVDAAETDIPKAQEQSPEPEVLMTAAERKKAKKNKKKQQKQESVQLDEQPMPEAEPTSTEEKSVEQSGDILPESEATPTAEAVAGVDHPAESEATRDLEAETKPEEEQAQDVPILDSELDPEAPADEAIPTPEIAEQAIDVQDRDKETAPEPTVEVPASTEDLQEEQKLESATSDQPTLDKSLDDKPAESAPEPVVEETQPTESTESPVAEQAEDEQAATSSKSKKKKNKKKKGQSVAAEEEQPAPAEEEAKLVPTEEEPTPVPAENETTEPAPSQELEQSSIDKDADTPIVAEEAPKAEETTQPEVPADAADTTATEAADEALMTPAQKRKAKKDKKKRQSVAVEEEQPTTAEEESKAVPIEEEVKPAPAEEEVKLEPAEEEPTPVPAENEPTEPAPSQELEQPSLDKDADTPIVAEEAPQAEETTQPEVSADIADTTATEAAEEALMTPAQKRKAKKDKKKRQSVVAEEEQSVPVDESKLEPAEEDVTPAPVEEEPTPESDQAEVTEPLLTQESEQAAVDKDAETPITTEEAPETGDASLEDVTQQDASTDAAATEAAEEALMTPAQKRKAKKDKKKRQSMIAEEEQPTSVEEPKPESPREEPIEPESTQETEQAAVDKDAETPIITKESPKAEEPSPEETMQLEGPTDAAATEAAAQAAEEASMTPAQKRKAKKDKKKRQSVVAEEEQPAPAEEPTPVDEPTPVEEPTPESAQEEPTEPESTQETEQPTVDKDAETPFITEEEAPKAEEPSLEEVTQQDAPADTAAAEAAEEEEAMTPAQKRKAKKDKKKQRKSVAFDDDATPTEEPKPEQDLSAPEDKIESQDAPADLVMSEESAKELPVTEEVAEPAAEGEVSEKTEEPASSEQSKEITEDELVSTAAPDTPIPAEAEEPKSAAELPEQPEQDAQTPSEPQSPSAQEPEVALTAAQRKKAKKNKKKGKSVDLADNALATDAAQESEPKSEFIVQTSTDTPPETPGLQDTPASETAQPAAGLEKENTIEAETPKAEELETTEAVSDDVPKEESPDAKETDNEPPATEAIVDAEPTASQEEEAIAPSPTEPTEEAGMSAKERRKAAKKAKKRQSKNVDGDNDAATSDSPSAPATEPATPIEAANSVEKVLTSTDTDAPGLSAVTASSPAEHDGKEHQSHDIETYDATAQNTASTDKYMSSQPVLERSVDSGELVEGNAQQEGDVAPTAHEREGELAEPAPLEEEMKPVDDGENVEEKSSVPEAGDLSAEKEIEETPVEVPIDVVPEAQTQEAPVEEEEASETAVSKKQKKKNKNKNKNKKQEEEAAAPDPETFIAEDKEQPEAAPLVEDEPQPEVKEITESEPIGEGELVPVPEEQPADHLQDIEEAAAVQPTEEVDDTKETSVLEAEAVALPAEETTHPEAPADAAAIEAAEEASMTPAQKRKAKKDKKKQHQSVLPPEPESEPQPEEQPAPEATETSVQETEIVTESAPADIITHDEAVTSAEERTLQPIDATEEAAKDLVTPEDTEQHVPNQEIESGERSLELPSIESKIEEGDKPAVEAAEIPAETPDDKQPSEQAPPEAAPEPEGESATVPKKMSKKEKKKAAAAAAAALLEEEKLGGSQPEAEEPSNITPQAPEEVVEQLIVQEPQPSETEDKLLLEAEKSLGQTTHVTTSELKEDVLEQPVEVPKSTEPLEFEDKPEESTKELADEPAAADTITRKKSKKDRKKAKKQDKQEVIEPASPPTEDRVPTTKPATAKAAPEPEAAFEGTPTDIVPTTQPATTEPAFEPEATLAETPTETITGPESIAPEEIEEAPKPEPENIEPPALEGLSIVSEDRQPSESEKNEGVASLDTVDTLSPAEPTDQDTNNEPLDTESPADEKNQEDQAHVGADAGDLEKTADLEVVEGLVEDRPGESGVIPALSKKMSKKDKRKAKKNAGITEEVSTQQQEELQADMTELPTEPVLEQEIPDEPEHAAEPQPTLERELSTEAPLPIEDQPIPEPEVQVELTQPEEEPAASEELPLSRKASKKKAKKAQKATKSLDTEPPAENAIDADQHATIVPFEEDQSKAQDLEAPDEKSAHSEEDWPAIDWQAKFEESQRLREADPEPEPDIPPPEPEIISEFVESSFPEVSQDPNEAAEQDDWALPSKKDKKKAKKNKKQSQQAAPEVEEPSLEPFNDKEIEPPARTTTPGGSKIANLFPGLERAGFRRSALDQTPSLKDSAEEETTADLEANRDIAIPVSEAPLATTETKEIAEDFTSELPSSLERQIESTISELKAHSETPTATEDESIREPELPTYGEKSLDEPLSLSREPSNERTRTEEPSSPTRLPPQAEAGEELCELRRSPSIHGRHQHPPRTWSLEEPSLQALPAPSPPRSLFGGPTDDYVRPRTPLDTIAEQEPRDGQGASMARRGTPRLELKPEHVLPRPQTPVRKFTDNAFDRETWPTENQKGEDFKPEILKTPEQGIPILKPSTSSGKLRRANRSISGDLRAASRALDSQPSNLDLDQLPSSSSYDPVTDKGKRPLRNMSDVYEGWGETPNSPRSPSRPPSVRRRRSMQHLQDIETRLDQLISENRLLIAARDEAEDKLRNTSVARRKSDRALNTRDGDLRDRESEVEQLKNSVEWLQKEMTRLTQENEGLTASNSALAAAHAAEVNTVRESSTRELADLQSQHTQLSSQIEDRVRQEIESALAQKDIELRRLRTELEEARDKVKELQQQIAASVHDNALVFRDEEYFDAACQKLCGHVQSWVVRFSKHNDKRRCRLLSELQDEKIADRFDNALLDGSDPDAYLSDRVRRRDVFMSVVMTMVWEYIFTRYLFGMDREQRQKLKSLEKQLGEVGPTRAVHRWRATTLTLLSRRPAFAAQRESDTEAVTLEIFQTLSRVLPPPSHVESQLLDNLRKIMRVAVSLSLEMRTQLAEFIMLPPLQPEYDTNGDLARQVYFNAALMNERSGLTNDNGELEAQQSIVRIVLFPLVVKKGNDVGEGDDEVVVCPAQVLIARPSKDKKVSRMVSGDRMSIDPSRSVHSIAQSIAHSVAPSSMMDMSNVI